MTSGTGIIVLHQKLRERVVPFSTIHDVGDGHVIECDWGYASRVLTFLEEQNLFGNLECTITTKMIPNDGSVKIPYIAYAVRNIHYVDNSSRKIHLKFNRAIFENREEIITFGLLSKWEIISLEPVYVTFVLKSIEYCKHASDKLWKGFAHHGLLYRGGLVYENDPLLESIEYKQYC